METVETCSGNTSTSHEKRIVPGKRWAFTVFNQAEMTEIKKKVLEKKNWSYIFGLEVCPTTGKIHWQCFINTNGTKIRPTEFFGTKQTHWEKALGTDDQNTEYCSKEGSFETNMKLRKKCIDPMDGKIFKDWQNEVLEIIKKPVDDRKIYWFWENKGGVGKSMLCKHLCMKYDAMLVGGKGNDIKYAVYTWLEEKDLDILIWDIPRNVGNTVSYSSIEEIKNGCMFNNKYESGMKIFNSPHIIIFANEEPILDKLSQDRWIIKEIHG